MGENIDSTWLAFAGGPQLDADSLDERLRRVERHYSGLVEYPLRARSALVDGRGIAVIGDAEPLCRWPLFASDRELAVGLAHVPYGWHRAVGDQPLGEACLAVGRMARDDPERAARILTAPVAIAVLDHASTSLTLVNDSLGAARVFELATPGLTVWSNRPGALSIFTGSRPGADPLGWRLLAAAGWLLGNASPIAGVRRVAGGSVISAGPDGIAARSTDSLTELVRPTGTFGELAAEAASEMSEQARRVDALWPEPADVDLSGGRDSRVVAAASVAAGLEARYLTSDATPGEADVARALVAAAPGEPDHVVRKQKGGSATPTTPLLERARNLHRLHDGVRHPQKLRGKMTLPRPRPQGAKLSGHGGEIAHGFFYKSRGELWRLRGSRRRLVARIMRFFEKGHGGASPESYAAAEEAVRDTLSAGRDRGMRGPALLDWFYLVDRFPHRSGMATDSERIALFAGPAVIAASFRLSPSERVEAKLHDELIARSVPAWREIPYFEAPSGPAPRLRRERLWEVEADALAVEEILAAGGDWTEHYDRDRALRLWRAARAGEGKGKWESLFEGIVYRATFDEHLAALARAATG